MADECPDPYATATKSVIEALSRYANDKKLADLTLVCRDKSWRVHRFALGLHSPVIARAWAGDFKEANEDTLNLSEDPPASVESLVKYIYELTYDDGCAKFYNINLFELHVQICTLADKYDIPALRDLAIKRFREAIWHASHTDIANAALTAYEAPGPCDKIRRDTIAHCIANKFLSSERSEGAFCAAMTECPSFAIDYAKELERQF